MEKLKNNNTKTASIILIVVLVILIILLALCTTLTLYNNAMLEIAMEVKENERLDEIYSSVKVATSDDSKLTITMQDLDSLISDKVEEQLANNTYVPAGLVISYMGNTAPEGYLFCDGATYNILDYPNLAEQIKNEFGIYNYYGGDGTTTFAVPNLQGEFLRGYSTASTASKTSGISTAAVGKHQAGTYHSMIGIHYNSSNDKWVGGYGAGLATSVNRNQDTSSGVSKGFVHSQSSATNINTSSTYVGKATHYTSRPTNTSVLYCIKY